MSKKKKRTQVTKSAATERHKSAKHTNRQTKKDEDLSYPGKLKSSASQKDMNDNNIIWKI